MRVKTKDDSGKEFDVDTNLIFSRTHLIVAVVGGLVLGAAFMGLGAKALDKYKEKHEEHNNHATIDPSKLKPVYDLDDNEMGSLVTE